MYAYSYMYLLPNKLKLRLYSTHSDTKDTVFEYA